MKSSQKIAILLLCILLASKINAQTGLVNNGAYITAGKGSAIYISGGTVAGYTNKSFGTNPGSFNLDGILRLEGNWNNNSSGNALINLNDTGEIQFTGSSLQSISGNPAIFENLIINNPTGLNLASDITVNNNLTLQTGLITLGSRNLSLGNNSLILGTPSSTAMIVATGAGELRKNFSDIGSFTYPVGDNNGLPDYTPATLSFSSGTFGGYAGVRVTDTKYPNNYSLNNYINRYWSVSQNGIGSFTCNATFEYADNDISGTESDIMTADFNKTEWSILNVANTSSNLLSGTVTAFGDFTGGESVAFSLTANMSDDGTITEGQENGKLITVNIGGDIFQSTLDSSSWTVTNLPEGVSKGIVTRVNNTSATVALSGNRTIDYDSDITNVTVKISGSEFVSNPSDRIMSNGVVLHAIVEKADISSGVSLTGANLDGAVISIAITNDKFSSPSISASNFALNNAPFGTTIGSVSYIDNTHATLNLSYSGTDFYSDINNFNITVKASSLIGVGDIISNNLSIAHVFKNDSIKISYAGNLTESKLNNAILSLSLINETFVDSLLLPSNFQLLNTPAGVSLGSVSYIDSSHAQITLAFDNTYFNNDRVIAINIAGIELSRDSNITSNTLPILASSAVISTSKPLTTQNLNGASISLTLNNIDFSDNSLNFLNFILQNYPSGITISSVSFIDTNHASIILAYDGTPMINDSANLNIKVNGSELTDNFGLTTNNLSIKQVKATINVAAGLSTNNLNGATIAIVLNNVSYYDSQLDKNNFTLNNAPAGTSINAVNYVDKTHANIILSFDGTVFTTDITNFSISIAASELSSNLALKSNNLTITAVITEIPAYEGYTIDLYSNMNNIFIKCDKPSELTGDIWVYDLLGRNIITKKLNETAVNKIPVYSADGYYIVKIINKDKILIRKVLIVNK